MSEELKNCPFCGGEATTSEKEGLQDRQPYGWGWVGCQKCRVFINWSNGDRGKKLAIAAWNKRTCGCKKQEG